MDVGFTGSRLGMTIGQVMALAGLLRETKAATFHHGCAIGADAQAHRAAEQIVGLQIHLHRPIEPFQMEPGLTGVEWQPKPFLKRNRLLVRSVRLLIGAPHGPDEHRSGTWSTLRYAKRIGRPIAVLSPNGEVLSGSSGFRLAER